jgi:hypothetical protein
VTETTYEIVGAVERFDERDTVFAREALIPGSPTETIYHEANPPSLFHKDVARFASKAPWAAGALVLADDLFFGRTYKRHPKPDWVGR